MGITQREALKTGALLASAGHLISGRWEHTGKGFACGSAGKESDCNAEDLGLIPGLGRSPGEGKGYPLQYSGLENSMDCIIHGITNSRHD